MNFNKEILANKIVFLSPLEPFTWASGIKSPIYCDNRLINGYPHLRNLVKKELGKLLEKNFPECEVVMGTATAGIIPGALVADELELPCGYVRSSTKKHGRQNQIEGVDISGKKVVVVEDLISTGGSVLEVVDILKEAGADVLGVVAIFSYNFKSGYENFESRGVSYHTISDIETLLGYAGSEKLLSEKEISLVQSFLEAPSLWYEKNFS